MTIGKSELKVNDLKVGQKVWIYPDKAEILAIAVLEFGEEEPEVEKGVHKILEIENVKSKFARSLISDKAKPIKTVLIQRLDSHGILVGSQILLAYNEDSHVIVGGGSVLIDEVLFPYFSNIKELQDLNSTRYTCVACDQPLNIVTNNIRICNDCENENERT